MRGRRIILLLIIPLVLACACWIIIKINRDKYTNAQDEIVKATEKGDSARVKKFLDEYPELVKEKPDLFGIAVMRGYTDIVGLLISKGVDVKAKGGFLHAAARHDNVELTKLLIQNGADLDARDSDGRTPLFITFYYRNQNVAKLLIESGADINAKDNKDWKPLHMACVYHCYPVAELLIKRGADVNARTYNGSTPLHEISYQQKKLVQLLIKNGADVNAKDNQLQTPLHLAVSSANVNAVEALIANGADVNAKDLDGETLLKRVLVPYIDPMQIYRRQKIAELLFEKGARTYDIYSAAAAGDVESIKSYIKKDCHIVNRKDKYGYTPLHIAAIYDRLAVAKLLILDGSNVNEKDEFASTPLHYASSCAGIGVVEYLISKGAKKDKEKGEKAKEKTGYIVSGALCCQARAKRVHFRLDSIG